MLKFLSRHDRDGIADLDDTTARWRLKQVLAKTDIHRQAELVRLLLSSAVLGEGAVDTSLTGGRL